tara:strand:- start:1465 stop:2031 length:567 start_codon:yes stop_codon:yes gene_type:complete
MVGFYEKEINGIDYSIKQFEKGEYEFCVFSNCNFNKADLTESKFIDCSFSDCNFSEVNIAGTAFQDARFIDCKLMGIGFENCNDFGFEVEFTDCILNYASFHKMRLIKTEFKNSKLIDVDFSESNLSGAVFSNCDLGNALFDKTNLMNSNFTTAFNYTIDPENNKIKNAKFSLPEVTGLLNKYSIKIV